MLLQAVWLDAGRDVAGELVLVVHHLAIDGVSWRILLPDLAAAWTAAAAGTTPVLSAPTTGVRTWAARLAAEARTPAREAEAAYWRGVVAEVTPLTPPLDRRRDTANTACSVTRTLPSAVTEALLTRVPVAFHGGIDDILVAALAVSVAAVEARAGRAHGTLLLDREGHGRDTSLAGVDLSRTIGWFTTIHPVRLTLTDLDVRAAAAGAAVSLNCAVKTIKEQLRQVPDKGLGWGLLRYLHPTIGPELAHGARASVALNYLGRVTIGAAAGEWHVVPGGLGGASDSRFPLAHALEVNATTIDGASGPELMAHWMWASHLMSDAWVSEVADTWEHVLTHLAAMTAITEVGGLTPSDVSLSGLTQAEIELLESAYAPVDDILPLAPLQAGLLFQTLREADGNDVYLVQVALRVEGAIDADVLRRSVQGLLQRHPTLRAAFVHRGLEQPVQVIPRHAPMTWIAEDWQGTGASVSARLDAFLRADREQRFTPSVAPLVRAAWLQLDAASGYLVLTLHHVLIDGWSLPILVRDLTALYAKGGDARELPRTTPYRHYLAWLARQDQDASRLAWRQAFAGLDEGSLLAPHASAKSVVGSGPSMDRPAGSADSGARAAGTVA